MTIMNTTDSERRTSALGQAISVPPETKNYHGGGARGGGGGGGKGDSSICPVEISIQGLGGEPKTEVAFLDKQDVGGPRLLVSLQSILALKHNGMKLKGMLDQTSTALGKCRQGYFKELLYLREKLRRQKKEAEEAGGGFSPNSPHGRSTTDHSTAEMPVDSPNANAGGDGLEPLDDDDVYLYNCPDFILEPGLKDSVMRFYKEMTRKLRSEVAELREQMGSKVITGLPSRMGRILTEYSWENVITTCFEQMSRIRTNKEWLDKFLEAYLIENAHKYESNKPKDENPRDLENKLRELNEEMREKTQMWEEKRKEAENALQTALREKESWEKKFWLEAKRVEALEDKEADNDWQTEAERLKKLVDDLTAQVADTEKRLADATKKHADAEERLAAFEHNRDQSAEERLLAEGERHAAAEGRKAAASQRATLAEENLAAALEQIFDLERQLSEALARAAAAEEARPPVVGEARPAVEEARPHLPVEKELNDLGTKPNDLEIESNDLEAEQAKWIFDRTAQEEKWRLAREEEEEKWRLAREKEEKAWATDRDKWKQGWDSVREEAREKEEELRQKNEEPCEAAANDDEATPGSDGGISSHRGLAWEGQKSALMDQINSLQEESEKKLEIIQTFEGYLKEANDAIVNCFNSYVGYEDSREEPVEESGDGGPQAGEAGSSQKLESEGLKLKAIMNQIMEQRPAAEAESTGTDLATLEATGTFIRDLGIIRVQEAIEMFGAVYDNDESSSETKLQTSNGEKYVTSIRAYRFIMLDMVRAENKARKIAAEKAEKSSGGAPIPEEPPAGKTKEPTPREPPELDEHESRADIPEPAVSEGDDKLAAAAAAEEQRAAAEAEAAAARARAAEADEKMDAAMALMSLAEAEATAARARMDEAAEKMAAAEALMAEAEAKAAGKSVHAHFEDELPSVEDHIKHDASSSGGAQDFDKKLAAAQARAAAAEDHAAECGRRAEDLCADVKNLRLQMGEMEATNLESLVQLKEKYEREMRARLEEAERQRVANMMGRIEDEVMQAAGAPHAATAEDTDPVVSNALVKEKVLKLRVEELVLHIKALESKLNDAGKTGWKGMKETWMDRDFQDFEVPYRIRSDALRNGMKRYHLLFHDAGCATKLRNHKMKERRRKNIMELEKNTREAFSFLKDTGFWNSSGDVDSPVSRDSRSFFTSSPLSLSPKRSRSPDKDKDKRSPISPRHERCFHSTYPRTGVATAPVYHRNFSPRDGGGSWLSRKRPSYLSSTHGPPPMGSVHSNSVHNNSATLSTDEFIVQWDEKLDPDTNSPKWDKHMTRVRRHSSSRSPRRLYRSSGAGHQRSQSAGKFSSTAPASSFFDSQGELSQSSQAQQQQKKDDRRKHGEGGIRELREVISADTEGLGRPHHASFACFDGRPNTEVRASRRKASRNTSPSSRSVSCMSDRNLMRTESRVGGGKWKSRSVSREVNGRETGDSTEKVYEQLSAAAAMEAHKPSSPTGMRLSPISTAASTLVSPHPTVPSTSEAAKAQGGGATARLMTPPYDAQYGSPNAMHNVVYSPMGSTLKIIKNTSKTPKASSRNTKSGLCKPLAPNTTSNLKDAGVIITSMSPSLDADIAMLPPLTTCGSTSQMKKHKSMTSVMSSSSYRGGGTSITSPRGGGFQQTANLRQLDTRALFTRKNGRSNERPKLVYDSIGGHSFGAARTMFGDFNVQSSGMNSDINYNISYSSTYSTSYLATTTTRNNNPQGAGNGDMPRGNGKSGNGNNRTGDDDSRPSPLVSEQMHASTLNNTSWLPKKKNASLISQPLKANMSTTTQGDFSDGRAVYEKSVSSRAARREVSNNRSRSQAEGAPGGDRNQANTGNTKEKSRAHRQAEQQASTVSNLRKELSASSLPLVYPKPEK